MEKLGVQDEKEIIKIVNDIQSFKADLPPEDVNDVDLLIEFYQKQNPSRQEGQQTQQPAPPSTEQPVSQTPQAPQQPAVPASQAQPPQTPVRREAPLQPATGSAPITPPAQQSNATLPVTPGTQQAPGLQKPQPRQPAQPAPAANVPFKKNFGDVNNPTIRGVGVGGSVSVVDAMTGKKSYITQTYANYNPKLEPTAGSRNWGTDFRGQVGDELKNPFEADLIVVKAVDGYGDGYLGSKDNQGFGNQLVVKRADTGEVLDMAHLNGGSLGGLKPGDRIKPGQKMAEIGKSGNVTGPHVSIETFNADGTVKDIADLQPIAPDKPNVSYDAGGAEVYKQEQYQPVEGFQQAESKGGIGSLTENLVDQVQGQQQAFEESLAQDPQSLTQQTPQPTQQAPMKGQYEQIINSLPEGQREVARQAIPGIASALQKEGILTPEVLAYTIATVSHESGFVPKQEIMAQRGLNPRNDYIADLQSKYSGGTDYRGRGYIQLTHDYNYKKYGDRIGVDLVANPDALLNADTSAKVLAAYMKDSGAADSVMKGDLNGARVKIQGQGALNSQFMPTTQEIGNLAKSLTEPASQYIDEGLETGESESILDTAQRKVSQLSENVKEIKEDPDKNKSFLDAFTKKDEASEDTANKDLFSTFSDDLSSSISPAKPEDVERFQEKVEEGKTLFSPAQNQAAELREQQQSTFKDPMGLFKGPQSQMGMSPGSQNTSNAVRSILGQRSQNNIPARAQAAVSGFRAAQQKSMSAMSGGRPASARPRPQQFRAPAPRPAPRPPSRPQARVSAPRQAFRGVQRAVQAVRRAVPPRAPSRPIAQRAAQAPRQAVRKAISSIGRFFRR